MLVLNNYAPDVRIHKAAKSLSSEGHEVQVFALWQAGLPESVDYPGYHLTRLKLASRTWQNRQVAPVVKYLEYAMKIWQLSKNNPAEAYQANDAITLPAAWIASRRNHAKLIYDAREFETNRDVSNIKLAGLYRIIWALPEKAFIRKADAVITVCESIADELRRIYAIAQPLVVMNCPEGPRPARSNRLREELGIPEEMKIALYQGGIFANRGIEQFFDAVQLVPGVIGVALGDGSLLSNLRARLQSGEWERVYLPGKVPMEELSTYTASADVGIATIQGSSASHRFALPNKLFENLQAGNPVIGSNLPEIARILREYQVGEIVDQTDPKSIAAGLHRLLDDPDYYDQTRKNALRAAERFNWEQEGAKLVHLYRCLGDMKAKPGGTR